MFVMRSDHFMPRIRLRLLMWKVMSAFVPRRVHDSLPCKRVLRTQALLTVITVITVSLPLYDTGLESLISVVVYLDRSVC